jgi:hypothetical protein
LNEGFGATTVTNSQAATEGQGTYESVASLENFLFGFRGERYRTEPQWLYTNNYSASSSVTGGGYDVIAIKFNSAVTEFKDAVSLKELLIAVPATVPDYADTANAANDLTDVLEVLAGLGTSALTMS